MNSEYIQIGKEIYEFEKRVFPYDRYLMGEGVRTTLEVMKETLSDMIIKNIPSGTKVFDWTVPDEWVIREAFIENENHIRIIDFKKNNLHVMAYSDAIDEWVGKDGLREYVFTNEQYPDVIPYVTSYYKDRVGMCMSHDMWESLDNYERYHIKVDSEKIKGNLTYGEYILKGESEDEIVFHSVVCHPSLANDELSGPVLATFLARELSKLDKRRFTYRFVFVPETIGAIVYLSENLEHLQKHLKAGFILSCEGDNGDYSYLPTISGCTLADRVAVKVLSTLHPEYKSYTFLDRGSDERQYNSPGVDLPVCLVCRTLAGQFKEYHTSADNMDFVSPEGFAGSFEVFWNIVKLLEENYIYKSKVLCEPQLGRRGLYSDISMLGSKISFKNNVDFIAFADGKRDMISISDATGIDFNTLAEIARIMKKNNLIEVVDEVW